MPRISTDEAELKYSNVTQRVIGVFFAVYNELGAGFLESVYVQALAIELLQAGLSVQREKPLSVWFRGSVVGNFRADLIVAEVVLVEAKSCSRLNHLHQAQTLNYLRATSLEVGLLLNFGPKPEFRRLLLDNHHKVTRR
jgi:GxxExxY protein